MSDETRAVPPGDIQRLRAEFPGWTFGAVWASAATGPDARRIWAQHGGFLLSAWTAEELAFQIYWIPGMAEGREDGG